MASEKTVGTELAFCFGVLGIPLNQQEKSNMILVENVSSDTIDKLFSYYGKKSDNARLLDNMWQVGNKVRRHMDNYIVVSPGRTVWEGGQKQSSSTLVGRDFTFSSLLSVSVKADSNVVFNRAPRILIIDLPKGNVPADRNEDWFIEVARDELQNFYNCFKSLPLNLPDTVEDYYNNFKGRERKNVLKNHITPYYNSNTTAQQLYRELCSNVAEKSANIFNRNINQLFSTSGGRNSIKNFCENCFRINSTQYILAGMDCSQQFAVEVPNSTTWNDSYDIKGIEASPRLEKGQPEVGIIITLKSKNGDIYNFTFRIEIRWSHGKLCGNPEGKLYKEFAYRNLPWVSDILR